MIEIEIKDFRWWRKVARFATTRVITLYAVIVLACIFFLDVRTLYRSILSSTLNRLIPDFTYFVEFIENGGSFVPSKTDLAEHLHYYQYLEQYIPWDSEVPALLGFVYYHSGQQQRAISAYEKAVRLNPIFFWTRYNLGLVYLLNNRPKEALAQFKVALESEPQNTWIVVTRSLVYSWMLATDDESFQRVNIRFKNGLLDTYSLVILTLEQQGDYADMFAMANMAVSGGRDSDGRFYYYSALAAFHVNRLDDARRILDEGIKKFSDCRDLYFLLARVYREQGREEQAIVWEKKASKISSIQKTGFSSIHDFELRIF